MLAVIMSASPAALLAAPAIECAPGDRFSIVTGTPCEQIQKTQSIFDDKVFSKECKSSLDSVLKLRDKMNRVSSDHDKKLQSLERSVSPQMIQNGSFKTSYTSLQNQKTLAVVAVLVDIDESLIAVGKNCGK